MSAALWRRLRWTGDNRSDTVAVPWLSSHQIDSSGALASETTAAVGAARREMRPFAPGAPLYSVRGAAQSILMLGARGHCGWTYVWCGEPEISLTKL